MIGWNTQRQEFLGNSWNEEIRSWAIGQLYFSHAQPTRLQTHGAIYIYISFEIYKGPATHKQTLSIPSKLLYPIFLFAFYEFLQVISSPSTSVVNFKQVKHYVFHFKFIFVFRYGNFLNFFFYFHFNFKFRTCLSLRT